MRSYRVALRPAKPFAFGRLFGVPVFGLPGNPASALASFEELVRPAVLCLLGRAPAVRPARWATLAEPVVQKPGRLHLLRAEVWREGDRWWARPAGHPGAGMIHSLARAGAWAVIPPDVEELPAGAEVEVRLLLDPP
jgi:molybdopterin molybdotransferase